SGDSREAWLAPPVVSTPSSVEIPSPADPFRFPAAAITWTSPCTRAKRAIAGRTIFSGSVGRVPGIFSFGGSTTSGLGGGGAGGVSTRAGGCGRTRFGSGGTAGGGSGVSGAGCGFSDATGGGVTTRVVGWGSSLDGRLPG